MANLTLPSWKKIIAKDTFNRMMKHKYQKELLKWVNATEIDNIPVENALDWNVMLIQMVWNIKNMDELSVEDWDYILEYAKEMPWFPWWNEDKGTEWSNTKD